MAPIRMARGVTARAAASPPPGGADDSVCGRVGMLMGLAFSVCGYLYDRLARLSTGFVSAVFRLAVPFCPKLDGGKPKDGVAL